MKDVWLPEFLDESLTDEMRDRFALLIGALLDKEHSFGSHEDPDVLQAIQYERQAVAVVDGLPWMSIPELEKMCIERCGALPSPKLSAPFGSEPGQN